jgi:hypothetical protein
MEPVLLAGTVGLSGAGMRSGFGSGSNIKWNAKGKKSKMIGLLSWNNDAGKAIFCTNYLLLKNCAK